MGKKKGSASTHVSSKGNSSETSSAVSGKTGTTSKKRKRGARSVKSTMTSKTYKTAQLEHFDDPCIPDKICGLSLFDFTMTFLPW
jgi:hypothetical protein